RRWTGLSHRWRLTRGQGGLLLRRRGCGRLRWRRNCSRRSRLFEQGEIRLRRWAWFRLVLGDRWYGSPLLFGKVLFFGKVLRSHYFDRDFLGGYRTERMHVGKQQQQRQ